MASEMIERVARAIYEASHPNKPYSLLTAPQREKCEGEARAALEVIREPTKEMVLAAFDGTTFQSAHEHEIADCWRLMIDTALADPLPVHKANME